MNGKALYRNQRQQDTLCTAMTETADMFNLVAVLDELMSVRRRRTRRDAEEAGRILRNRPCSGAAKMSRDMRVKLVAGVFAIAFVPHVAAGQLATPTKPAAVEKLGPNLFRLGAVRVDTANREVSVSGKVNPDVMTLEFIANTEDGWRAYESAVSLDTDAITYNAALVLIGLDGSHAKGVPQQHFDPTALSGDIVTVTLECPKGECERMPAERLMFDRSKKETVSGGKWIYTGSSFLADGRFVADVGAVLIG